MGFVPRGHEGESANRCLEAVGDAAAVHLLLVKIIEEINVGASDVFELVDQVCQGDA